MSLKFNWTNHEIKSKTVKVPYGWKKPTVGFVERDDLSVDELMEENFGHFVVDYELVPFIEKALNSINNGTSLRDAANWLTVASGKPISHAGIKILWDKVVVDKENTDYQARLDTWAKPKTREEKKRRTLVKRKAAAKRAVTVNQKKLNRLVGTLADDDTLDSSDNVVGSVYSDIPVEADVFFKPNPGPQEDFLRASEQEVLYGGAAGGGKSFAILADPMRYFEHPKFNGLIIRRTNDELRDLIRESKALYSQYHKDAKFNSQSSTWTFPSGATLWMSYLERDDDVMRYQGQAFSWIAVDELTQYATPFAWNYLRSRLRTTAKDLPLSMRATTNPGGPGHQWVKKMFIDPAPPGTSFIARDLDTNAPLVYPRGHSKAGQPLFKRKFIPARLSDNPYLYEDGQYEASLLSLPEHQRRQLLEGDWSLVQGAAFPEFRPSVHVTAPFTVPADWRRFRSCDYGYSSYAAVLWFAINPVDNQLVVYRELYVTKFTGKDLARKIVQIEQDAGERVSYGILDSSVFHNRGNSGPVISEEMASEGVRFRPSDRGKGSRIAGRNRLHELLKLQEVGFDPETNSPIEAPGIIFFNTCRQTISDLQVIPTDPKGGEDIDDRFVSDHTYDALRYGIMSRPKPHSFYQAFDMTSDEYRPSNSTFGY